MGSKRDAVPFDDELILVDGVYYYRGTPAGTKRRREISLRIRIGAKQRDVMRAKLAALEGLERAGSRSGINSFEAVAKNYVKAREDEAKNPRHLARSSLRECRQMMITHLIPFFRTKRVEDIDQPLWSDYCRLKKQEGLNLVNHRKVINHFMRWCAMEGYLKYRPDLVIPKWAAKSRRARVVLTNDQVLRLITACREADNGRISLYVSMYLLMGMRNKEICCLRWDEVDLVRGVLRVNPENNRTRKARVLPINPHVLELLRARSKEQKTDWVFPVRRKGSKKPHMDPSGGFRKAWVRVLKACDLTGLITPHDLRSTFETHMHVNVAFTDTQREKMAGAKIDVQKNIYVTMDARQLTGLENSVQIPGLSEVLGGNAGGKKTKAKRSKSVTKQKNSEKVK